MLARGALAGARGNSGVIVSQFLRSLAAELADTASLCVGRRRLLLERPAGTAAEPAGRRHSGLAGSRSRRHG